MYFVIAGRYRLRPLVLNDVSKMDLSTTILGNHINFPICSSPFSMLGIGENFIGCDGALAVARGEIYFLMRQLSTCKVKCA